VSSDVVRGLCVFYVKSLHLIQHILSIYNSFSSSQQVFSTSSVLIKFCTPNQNIRVIKSRRMRSAGYVTRMGDKRGAYNVLVGRLEGQSQLGRPRRGWKDNVKGDAQEVK
jgi:hypothetical protein